VKISSKNKATVTEAIATPYGIARDTPGRAIHSFMPRLTIAQRFFHVWVWVPGNEDQLAFVCALTLARIPTAHNAP
jgi:hypothetical protein